jgi:SAM-dependent methyltransferase
MFLAGVAERLPFPAESFDLITAAGSLNYADLGPFFSEAARILRPSGLVVAYDFSPGRTFPGSDALDRWFDGFMTRYPPPVGDARTLSPEILAAESAPLRPGPAGGFRVAVELTPDEYVRYMLTETNVARAVENGADPGEIETWCRETLSGIYGTNRQEVLFEGYYALFVHA